MAEMTCCPQCHSYRTRKRFHLGHKNKPQSKKTVHQENRHFCNEQDLNKSDKEHMHYYCEECSFDFTKDMIQMP